MSRRGRILRAVARAAAIVAAIVVTAFAVTFVLAVVDILIGPWGVIGAVALAGMVIVAILEYRDYD